MRYARVTSLLVLAAGSAANELPLDAAAGRLFTRLELVLWNASLDDDDRRLVAEGLRHEHPRVLTRAITNALIDGDARWAPQVRDLATRSDACGRVASLAIPCLGRGGSEPASRFSEAARVATGWSEREAVTEVAVLLQVRELRQKARKEPAVEGLKLDDWQQMLLEYACMEEEKAIETLVARMEGLTKIAKPWSFVLASYGEAGARAALARLEREEGVSVYGRVALIRALYTMAICGSPELRARIGKVADRHSTSREPPVKTAAMSVANIVADTERLEGEKR